MPKLDKPTVAQVVFCLLVTGIGAGCGDDTGSKAKLDAAVDATADVPGADAAKPGADAAKTDTLAPPDLSRADAPESDTPMTDVPLPRDTAPDGPATLDVANGETGLDSSAVDTGLVPDVAGDAPPALDTGAVETGGIDGTTAVDAEGMTTASITFRLHNQGAQPVYVRSNCWIPFDVTSLADGTVYANRFFCACSCAEALCTGPVACAPCPPPDGLEVAPGQTRDLSWQARKSTLETKTGTQGPFECVAHAPIATGAYRVSVSVYPTEEDAAAETNGRVVQQSFTLGTANAVVTVPVL